MPTAGACDSYASGTGAKRLVPLSEPDTVMDLEKTKRAVWQPASVQRRIPGIKHL